MLYLFYRNVKDITVLGYWFLPRDAMRKRGLAVARCPSVRLSVSVGASYLDA